MSYNMYKIKLYILTENNIKRHQTSVFSNNICFPYNSCTYFPSTTPLVLLNKYCSFVGFYGSVVFMFLR